MGKFLLSALSFVFLVSFSNSAAALTLTPDQLAMDAVIRAQIEEEEAPQGPSLEDFLSPEEIAQELGVPDFDGSLFANENARLKIIVDKARQGKSPSAQTMRVYLDGDLVFQWLVSTGREKPEKAKSGKRYFSATPVGSFSITWMNKRHYSKTWQAPMPFAIFFRGGIAIHATTKSHYKELGSRASGGCVRLSYENAATLWKLVEQVGKNEVLIKVYDGSKY